MAVQQLSWPRPALSVVRGSSGGITQVREHQRDRYTIIGNHLTQHSELTLLAIGLGTYVLSLPDGAHIDIRTLARRFPEGRDRIAAALRELETYGYVERVRERTPEGRIITRTFIYNAPEITRSRLAHAARPATPTAPAPADTPPPPPPPQRAERPAAPPLPEPQSVTPEKHEAAVSLLSGLRREDPRLLLPQRDVHRLAPAVATWLERGVPPEAVRRVLTTHLPPDLSHPPGLLAHRLTALLPPPLPPAPPASPRPHPMQVCDSCDHGFRAPTPGLCRPCRDAGSAQPRAA